MRKSFFPSCSLLLASFGLVACAASTPPKHAYSWEDKKEVAPSQLYTLKAHRRDDYSGRYYYEEDRYARMTRWHDPIYIMPASEPSKAVAPATR